MRTRSRVLLVVALAALSACGGRAASAPRGVEVGAPTPAGAVERFMAHVAEGEIRQMGWVFGTPAGPLAARQSAEHVRQRMIGLAAVLQHERYSLQGLTPVLGRPEARQVLVEIRKPGRTHQVPFVVVQGPRNRWFVENFAVEALVGRQ